MTQTIDPIKLKAAAEHLEWVLRQYPESGDVQALLHGLLPLIQDAKNGEVKAPVDRSYIPFSYSFMDGPYKPYREPNVGSAYADFVTEMGGEQTEQDKKRRAEMESYRRSLLGDV